MTTHILVTLGAKAERVGSFTMNQTEIRPPHLAATVDIYKISSPVSFLCIAGSPWEECFGISLCDTLDEAMMLAKNMATQALRIRSATKLPPEDTTKKDNKSVKEKPAGENK